MEFTSIFHEAVITEDKSDIARTHSVDRWKQKERSEQGISKSRGSKDPNDVSTRSVAGKAGLKGTKNSVDTANKEITNHFNNELRKTRHESTFLDSIELI